MGTSFEKDVEVVYGPGDQQVCDIAINSSGLRVEEIDVAEEVVSSLHVFLSVASMESWCVSRKASVQLIGSLGGLFKSFFVWGGKTKYNSRARVVLDSISIGSPCFQVISSVPGKRVNLVAFLTCLDGHVGEALSFCINDAGMSSDSVSSFFGGVAAPIFFAIYYCKVRSASTLLASMNDFATTVNVLDEAHGIMSYITYRMHALEVAYRDKRMDRRSYSRQRLALDKIRLNAVPVLYA